MAKKKRRRSTSKRYSALPKKFRRRARRGFAALRSTFSLQGAMTQGLVGAGALLGIDLVVSKVLSKLPASLQSDTMRPVVKAAVGVGLGFAATKIGALRKYAGTIAAAGVMAAVADVGRRKLGISGIDYFPDDSGGMLLPGGQFVDGMGNVYANYANQWYPQYA